MHRERKVIRRQKCIYIFKQTCQTRVSVVVYINVFVVHTYSFWLYFPYRLSTLHISSSHSSYRCYNISVFFLGKYGLNLQTLIIVIILQCFLFFHDNLALFKRGNFFYLNIFISKIIVLIYLRIQCQFVFRNSSLNLNVI